MKHLYNIRAHISTLQMICLILNWNECAAFLWRATRSMQLRQTFIYSSHTQRNNNKKAALHSHIHSVQDEDEFN